MRPQEILLSEVKNVVKTKCSEVKLRTKTEEVTSDIPGKSVLGRNNECEPEIAEMATLRPRPRRSQDKDVSQDFGSEGQYESPSRVRTVGDELDNTLPLEVAVQLSKVAEAALEIFPLVTGD